MLARSSKVVPILWRACMGSPEIVEDVADQQRNGLLSHGHDDVAGVLSVLPLQQWTLRSPLCNHSSTLRHPSAGGSSTLEARRHGSHIKEALSTLSVAVKVDTKGSLSSKRRQKNRS